MEEESCLVCFQLIPIKMSICEDPGRQYGDNSYKLKLFQCCRNLLRGVGIKSSFNWNSELSPNSLSPFCSNCFQISETLWLMEEKLNEIKKDLDKYIERFSAEILQSRINALSQKVSVSVEDENISLTSIDNISDSNTLITPLSIQHHPDDVTDSISMNNDTDLTRSPSSPTHSMEIKIESPKLEVDYEDFYEDDFGSEINTLDTNLPISIENDRIEDDKQNNDSDQQLEKNPSPCQQLSRMEIFKISPFRTLRVSLERLKLDSKGRIIQPLRINKRLGKRKAAMAAKKLLRKNILQEDYLTENNILPTTRHNDDDFVNDYLNSDVGESEDDTKVRIPKNVKGKTKAHSTSPTELKCGVCSSKFLFASQLDTHSKEMDHNNEKTVECHKCHEKFYRDKEKDWHLRTCKFVSKSCRICGDTFTSFNLYRYHLRDHRKPNPTKRRNRNKSHKCLKCQMSFPTRLSLLEHRKTHPDGRTKLARRKRQNHTAETGGSSTENARENDLTVGNLDKNNSNICRRRVYEDLKCSICSAKFIFSSHLDVHSLETGHKNEKTIECLNCHETFYRVKEKEWHLRTCNFVTRNCRICGEIFTSFKLYRYHLRDHRKAKTNRKTKSHKCVKCHLSFFTRLNLLEHMKTHTKRKKVFEKTDQEKNTIETKGSTADPRENDNIAASNNSPELNGSDDDVKGSKAAVYSYEELKCISCSMQFRLTSELDSHSEKSGHVNEKLFECLKCKRKFYRDRDLHSHKRYCEFGSRPCFVCGNTFTSLSRYRFHLKSHSGTTVTYPRKPLSKSKRAAAALKRELKNTRYDCNICRKSFSGKVYLANHMYTHTGERPYKCDIGECKASFGYHSELSHHKADHENRNKVQCTTCGLFYKNDMRLELHINREHSEDKTIQCDACEMKFKRMSHFVSHKISSHGMESPYKCKHCSISFNYKLDLTTHLSSAHGERPPTGKEYHCCTVCDQMFRNATSLYYHTLSHTTIPLEIIKNNTKYYENVKGSYQCEECGKVFPYVSYLNTHMTNVHSERILPCKICGKTFKTKSVLHIHEKIHTDERVVCEICGRGFTKKCNLDTHIKRIHVQNKKPRKSYTKTPFAVPK